GRRAVRNGTAGRAELGGNGMGVADVSNGRGGGGLVRGRSGDGTLRGGVGDDTLAGGLGADELNGGGGFDLASYLNAVELGGAAQVFVADLKTGSLSDTFGSTDTLSSI